jgi:heme/copper-type cytochrome/quinol oxidase subunit 2
LLVPLNDPFAGGSQGDWLPIVLPIVLVFWLATLWSILHRADFDSVTRLTWVVVVIFVPVFGMVMYWCSNPPARRAERSSNGSDLSGTPWENNPDYKLPKK